MFLDMPHDVIRSMACFRLRAHTLRIETVTWTHDPFPTCDLGNPNDVEDEQHALFHCTHPQVVSLRRMYASLFPPAGFNNVSAFIGQETGFISSFMHITIKFSISRRSSTS